MNSTGVNGDPDCPAGTTGCTWAATFTFTARTRAAGSASMTSITHSGCPVVLSLDWTNFSPVEGVEVPYRLERASRVRPGREHHAELHWDRTLQCHWQLLVDTGLLGQLTKQVHSRYDDTTCLVKRSG